MVKYECDRCGYSSLLKPNFIKHLNRKYICKPKIKDITIPPRPKNYRLVYHLYIVFAKDRNKLLDYCIKKGIEVKIHYPIPIYRQPAMKFLKHKIGDFPITDSHTKKIITFPCDQHLSKSQLDYIIKTVKNFYEKKN